MTPDKRATLLKVLQWVIPTALLLGGVITAAQWFGVVIL